MLSYSAAEETCRSAEPRSHLPSVHSVQEVTSLSLSLSLISFYHCQVMFLRELGRRSGWFGEDQGVYLGARSPNCHPAVIKTLSS